jgi:hypothetical protein
VNRLPCGSLNLSMTRLLGSCLPHFGKLKVGIAGIISL